MKNYFWLFLLLLISRSGFCTGVIQNDCYSVNKKGELVRDQGALLCRDMGAKYDSTSASGLTGINGNYQISIEKNNELANIFEMNDISNKSNISADFPAVSLTTLSQGNIMDHTFCNRGISKIGPFAKKDSQQCLTINSDFCVKLNREVLADKNGGFVFGRKSEAPITEKDMVKCTSILLKASQILKGALEDSDEVYQNLASAQFKKIKTFTDTKLLPEMKTALEHNYNLSEKKDAKAGIAEVENASFASIFKLRDLYSKCVKFFPTESVAIGRPAENKPRTSTKANR